MSRILFLFYSLFCFITISYAKDKDVLKVGWIGPLSGNYAPLGVDSMEVAKDVVTAADAGHELGEIKVKFYVEDDQYQTTKTVTAYNHLVEVEGVKILFVLSYNGLLTIAHRAARDGVMLIDPLDCDDELAALPGNVFCIAKRTEDIGRRAGEHVVKSKLSPAAIIYVENDSFLPKVAEAAQKAILSAGREVVLMEAVELGTNDFKPLLVRAKAKGAKAIMLYGSESFGSLLRQAKELKVGEAYYALATIVTPGFRATAGEAVNGVYVSGWFAPRTESYKEFMANYKTRKGHEPMVEVSTIPTYDAANIIIDCAKKTKSTKPQQLAPCFFAVKDYQGLSGKISVDPDGAVRSLDVGMYVYTREQFVPVE